MEIARRNLLLVISLIGARTASAGLALDDFGGSLALTSDYVYHGLSQTCGDPAAQGDVHYRSAGGHSPNEAYAGVWGSAGLGQAGCTTAREYNLYAGYSFEAGRDSSASLTYTHYGFPGGSYYLAPQAGRRYDYDTLEAQWAWHDQVYLSVAWTPDALGYVNHAIVRDRNALSYGLQLQQPLALGISLAAGIGYDEVADPFGTGVWVWNIGIGYVLGAMHFEVGYFGTSERADRLFGSYVAGSRGSASVVWRF